MVGQSIASFNIVQIPCILLGSSASADVSIRHRPQIVYLLSSHRLSSVGSFL